MLNLMTLEKHYSVKQVAKLLNMGERTIWGWIKDGKLKAVKVGAIVRIPASALAALGFSVIEPDDDPDPATAEYEHIKKQWANRPEAGNDEPTNPN